MNDVTHDPYQSLAFSLWAAEIDLVSFRKWFFSQYSFARPFFDRRSQQGAPLGSDFVYFDDIYQKLLFSRVFIKEICPSNTTLLETPIVEKSFSYRHKFSELLAKEPEKNETYFFTDFSESKRLFVDDLDSFSNIHSPSIAHTNRSALMWAAASFLPFGYQFRKTLSTNHTHVFSKKITAKHTVSLVLRGTARMAQIWNSPGHQTGKIETYFTVHTPSPRPSFEAFRNIMSFPFFELLPVTTFTRNFPAKNAKELGFLSAMLFRSFACLSDPIESAVRLALEQAS